MFSQEEGDSPNFHTSNTRQWEHNTNVQDLRDFTNNKLHLRCVMSLTTHDVLLERIAESKKPTQSGKPRRDRFEATLPGSLLLQGLFSMGEVSP